MIEFCLRQQIQNSKWSERLIFWVAKKWKRMHPRIYTDLKFRWTISVVSGSIINSNALNLKNLNILEWLVCILVKNVDLVEYLV